MKHRAFFGDMNYDFALTDPMIAELERNTGTGFGALYQRCADMAFSLRDITETIRLGLIGGGLEPELAGRLVAVYAVNQPIEPLFLLAVDILSARWIGADENEAEGEAA